MNRSRSRRRVIMGERFERYLQRGEGGKVSTRPYLGFQPRRGIVQRPVHVQDQHVGCYHGRGRCCWRLGRWASRRSSSSRSRRAAGAARLRRRTRHKQQEQQEQRLSEREQRLQVDWRTPPLPPARRDDHLSGASCDCTCRWFGLFYLERFGRLGRLRRGFRCRSRWDPRGKMKTPRPPRNRVALELGLRLDRASCMRAAGPSPRRR